MNLQKRTNGFLSNSIKKRTAEILMRNFAVLFLFFVCRLELLYDITREQATRNDIVTAEGYAYSLENSWPFSPVFTSRLTASISFCVYLSVFITPSRPCKMKTRIAEVSL